MKVIFVAPKANLKKSLIEKIEKVAEVYFIESNPIDIRNIDILKEKGEKILCPFPEPMSWNFPSEYIKSIPDLKAICLSTTGYNWINGDLARNLNVNLTNVPNPPNAVAEGALFKMLNLARRYTETSEKKTFEYTPENYLLELQGKTMGVIGLGKIGTRIAEIGKALGMKVIYWSKTTRNENFNYLSMDEILKKSDFIFLCVVSNKETDNLISKDKIDLMQPTASMILISNKGVIDIKHLIQKVENKELYGCAFEEDADKRGNYNGNIFTTLKNNWYTKETVDKKMEVWVDNIIGCINNSPVNLVN